MIMDSWQDPVKEYVSFSDLPLSRATLVGLSSASFTTLTPIQARALPLALKGEVDFL